MTLTSKARAHATAPPVVVGIDGSQAAIQAAEWAAEEAVAKQVRVKLVYVISEESEPAPFAAIGNERMEHEFAETALRIAAAAVEANCHGLRVQRAMLYGNPATELIRESRDAAMLCLGSSGIGRVSEMLFGSTAVEVAEAGHCPVAIVRSRHSMPRPMVVALNSTPDGDDVVLGQALAEARLRHAPLLVVRTSCTDGDHRPRPQRERPAQTWTVDHPDVEIHTAHTRDEVGEILAASGRQIQLVVIGTRDIEQLRSLVGPRRHSLLEHTECSVLIARPAVPKASQRCS